jgi:hypothetical protein
MPFPVFFIHPPKSSGSTVISLFDLNMDKDWFANFVWDRESWGSCRAKLLETRICGVHHP